MLKNNITKSVIIITLVFKVVVNAYLPISAHGGTVYYVAGTYLLFNILMILTIFKDPIEYVKRSVAMAIVVDQIYSLIINVYYTMPIEDMVYTYPPLSLLYFIGVETFSPSRVLMIIITISSLLFMLHMIHELRGSMKQVESYLISIYALSIVIMGYKSIVKRNA